jgi:hypothetical protein
LKLRFKDTEQTPCFILSAATFDGGYMVSGGDVAAE